MKLYHSYHKSRKNEHLFLDFLHNSITDLDYTKENYRFRHGQFDSSIELKPVIKSLENDIFLPKKRKQDCINILLGLRQEKVRVFKSVNDISIDFTIEYESELHFIELHENQHKKLKDYRKKVIYSLELQPIYVPRYLVRLLKDIWRWQNLDNYKIIWTDYFSASSLNVSDLLIRGKAEYGLDNTFQFKNLGI